MVKTCESNNKRIYVPLCPNYVGPYHWFEYNNLLYLAIKWTNHSGNGDKWSLDAVCFDSEHYTMQASFSNTEGMKAFLVPDSTVSINYEVAKEA